VLYGKTIEANPDSYSSNGHPIPHWDAGHFIPTGRSGQFDSTIIRFQKKRRNDSDSIRKPSTRMACTPGCQQKPERAASFFRQAVSQDVLHLDAWLRLAESEAA
jgi:hypothetical protein